jgi:hypothetical protein
MWHKSASWRLLPGCASAGRRCLMDKQKLWRRKRSTVLANLPPPSDSRSSSGEVAAEDVQNLSSPHEIDTGRRGGLFSPAIQDWKCSLQLEGSGVEHANWHSDLHTGCSLNYISPGCSPQVWWAPTFLGAHLPNYTASYIMSRLRRWDSRGPGLKSGPGDRLSNWIFVFLRPIRKIPE